MRASSTPRRRGGRTTRTGMSACVTVLPALIMSGTYPNSASCDLSADPLVSAPPGRRPLCLDVAGRTPCPRPVREEVPEAVAVHALARGLAEDGDVLAPVGHADDLAAAVRRAAQQQFARGDDASVVLLPAVVTALAPVAGLARVVLAGAGGVLAGAGVAAAVPVVVRERGGDGHGGDESAGGGGYGEAGEGGTQGHGRYLHGQGRS